MCDSSVCISDIVAIVQQWGLYIILRISLLGRGLYIVHETGRRLLSGLLNTNLVCRRRRLPPLLVVASCGGR